MAVELVNLPKNVGNSNPTGVAPRIFLVLASWIENFPGPPTSPGPGETLLMNGPMTMVNPLTQGFVEMYVTAKTAKNTMELVGQKDSKNFDIKLEFFHPGLNPVFLERLLQDDDYVAVFQHPDCTDNRRYVIGQPCNPAELMGSYDSGLQGAADGRKGWSGMLTYFGPDVRYFDHATNPHPLMPE